MNENSQQNPLEYPAYEAMNQNNQYPNTNLPYTAPPPVDQPTVTEPSHPEPKKRSRKGMFIVGLLIIFFVISTSFVGASLGIAYNRISLPNKDLENAIKGFVLSIPFMPKTPEFVLAKSFEAHQGVSTHYFDVSMAITSDSLLSDLGLSNLDVKIEGDVDYTDTDNVQFQMDGAVGGLFAASARKKDSRIYTKVDQIPKLLLKPLFEDTSALDHLLGTWFYYDFEPLETAARDLVSEQEQDSITNELVTKIVEALSDDRILEKLTLTTEQYDDEQVYKIDFMATGEDIDYIDQKLVEALGDEYFDGDFKLSSIIGKLEVSLRVGKQDYLVRWASSVVDIENTDEVAESVYLLSPYTTDIGKISTAFVIKMSNYNQDVVIEAPENAITAEEMIERLLESVSPEEDSTSSARVSNLPDTITVQR